MFDNNKDKEMYFKVSKDLYNEDIFDDNEFNSNEDDYNWNKEQIAKIKMILNYKSHYSI